MIAIFNSLPVKEGAADQIVSQSVGSPSGKKSSRLIMMRLPGSSFTHITTVTMTGGYEAVKVLVQNVTNANNLRSPPPRCLHLDLGGLLHSPRFLEVAAFS